MRFLLGLLAVSLVLALPVPHSGETAAQTVPRITRTIFVFGAESNNTYERGEELRVRVQFGSRVVVTGAPQIGIQIGSQTRWATVVENSEDIPYFTLDFIYAVQSGDSDTDGASIPANSIRLNGGSIRSATDRSVNASLAHAPVPTDGARRVNGSLVSAPQVSNSGGYFVFSNPPADGTTYTRGEEIWVVVQMDRAVTVTGAPRVGIRIGSNTRYASYDSDARSEAGSPNADFRLWFTYTVQSSDTDTDGINNPTNAISLNGGTIRLKGTTTNADLRNDSKNPQPNRKVDGSRFSAPAIDSISFFKNGPAFGDTYGKGETIEAVVFFDHPLTVTGTPKLTLAIGSNNRDALYPAPSPQAHHQTLHRRMRFRYTVQASDRDTNGLSIAVNALSLNGGTIRAAGTTTNAGITHSAVAANANLKVDGNLVTPKLRQVAFGNSPASSSTYRLTEEIEVTTRFDSTVTVGTSGGTPSVALSVGSNTRQATYARGSGQNTLVFSYTVQTGDLDADGIEVAPNSLLLNGGTVTLASGTAPADLQHDALGTSASRQVNGSPPTPSGVAFRTTGPYELGVDVRVAVAFDLGVIVTGSPRLALTIGADTIQAEYDASASGSDTLVFAYTVQPTDMDSDGISIAADALSLNSGTIKAVVAPTVDANLDLGSHAVMNASSHAVDGSAETAPSVTGAAFVGSPPSGDTYGTTEEMRVAVSFDRVVAVTGTPELTLTIGTGTGQARYDPGASTNRRLEFAYRVRIGDLDSDGAGVAADALTLAGGTILLAGGSTGADLDLGAHAISADANHKVEGRPPAPSGLGFRTTGPYDLGEELRVAVAFDFGVIVTGSPQLALTIGADTVQSAYVASASGNDTLVFAYTVQSSDVDTDGLSVDADALSLNGGAVRAVLDPTKDADLDLGSHAVSNASGQAVDGRVETAPSVTDAAFVGSPASGDTYGTGEVMRVAVSFDRIVEVTGTPQLAISIGTELRQASYQAAASTSRRLVFGYQVRIGDTDPNGGGVGSGALTLADGTINLAGSSTAAELSLGVHAFSDDASHKVEGLPPAPNGVAFRTTGPYELGEEVWAAVSFDFPVNVTGTPRLALEIGTDTRWASYNASRSRSDTLVFVYTVQSADRDPDGISVAADALDLNGGTIRDMVDVAADADLDLASHAVSNVAGQTVDGSVESAPTVTGLAFTSTPARANSYYRGEEITVVVAFNRAVAATGRPQLALKIGGARRTAIYRSGSGTRFLTFGYVVQSTDYDGDGISIPADALLLNNGTVKIAGGATDAVLDLGTHAVGNVLNHRVDGPGELAFARPEYEFELVEDVAGPLVVGTVSAEDPFGGELAYELGDGSEGLFEVDIWSGEVTYVGEGEDAEQRSNYLMEVRALADDGRVGRAVVRVLVVNVNDPPVFVAERFEFGLPENVVGPWAVGVAEAVDLDEGDTLTYALESDGGADGLFELDMGTGEVTYLGAGEDYEAEEGAKSWELTVSATDLAGLRADVVVMVLLRDENEAPAFADTAYAFGLAENAAGPVLLGKVAATDPDAGDRVRYALVEGDGERFKVVAPSGVVRYVGGGEDAEAGPGGWELVVRATDGGGLTAAVRVEVAVLDENEAPVFGAEKYEWELDEGVAGPVALGAVAAVDADAADTVRYLLAGAGSERFEVLAASGVVRYAGPGEDYEAAGPAVWEFVVVAVDRAGLSTVVPAAVRLLDVNEAPVFADSAYAFELSENASGPMLLGEVEATDEDEGDVLTYSLAVARGDAGRFEVDGATGEVRYVDAGEDYETGPASFALTVRVEDADGLADTASVTVAVLNENEAPAFADSAYAFELSENARGPVLLGQTEATDPDEDDALTYSLARGDAGRFEVDGATGEVRYVGPGEDYEAGPASFALTVRVEDAGGLADEASATVELLDENEGPEAVGAMAPQVLEAYGAAAEEDLAPYFRDPDGDALSYVAESSAPKVATASVTASGRLSIAPQALGMATVTVTASDPGGLTATQQVQVTVEPSRAERARTLQMALTAFGRSLGAETVDVIGGRLGLESSSGGLGSSHLSLGGRSLGCDAFGAGAGSPGGPGGQQCGIGDLARSASSLLGMQFTAPRAASAVPGGGAAGAHLDMAALLFGGAGAMGGPGAMDATGGFGGGGGTYTSQQEGADRIERGSLAFDPLSGRDLLSGSSFQLSFGGNDADASVSDAAGAPQASPSRRGWTLWGQANGSEFESAPNDGLLLEGGTRSIYAGLDYRFGSGLLLGLAGSRSTLDSEFTSRHNGTGTVDARLTSLYPYLHWSPRQGLGLWGLVGAGRGSADLTEAVGGRFSTDIRMRMAALGARQELIGPLALKADMFTVRIDSDAAVDLAGVTAVAQRVRIAPELSGRWMVGEGAALQGRLGLGGRWDTGDAERGLGAEAGATLGFAHVPTGLSVEARGRALVAHQTSAFKEWGTGFAVRLQPGREQGGLSFSVEPSWGDASVSDTSGTDMPGWTPDRLALELGWGVVLPGGAQVTPFGRWSRNSATGHLLNLGVAAQRAALGQADGSVAQGPLHFTLRLFGEHLSDGHLPPQRHLSVEGSIALR